jgi:hypothetical protein
LGQLIRGRAGLKVLKASSWQAELLAAQLGSPTRNTASRKSPAIRAYPGAEAPASPVI